MVEEKMNKEIKKYDENNNEIYSIFYNGTKVWKEYDEKNNMIHFKNSDGYEDWAEFDENNHLVHIKNTNGYEYWYKYDGSGKQIKITEKEYKEIEFRKQEKEYLSRIKCSRFELMDI